MHKFPTPGMEETVAAAGQKEETHNSLQPTHLTILYIELAVSKSTNFQYIFVPVIYISILQIKHLSKILANQMQLSIGLIMSTAIKAYVRT